METTIVYWGDIGVILVQGSLIKVYGLWLRIQSLGIRLQGFGFRATWTCASSFRGEDGDGLGPNKP